MLLLLFDWGGTLTPWHAVNLSACWLAVAELIDPERTAELARALEGAELAVWDPGAGRASQRDAGRGVRDGGRHDYRGRAGEVQGTLGAAQP